MTIPSATYGRRTTLKRSFDRYEFPSRNAQTPRDAPGETFRTPPRPATVQALGLLALERGPGTVMGCRGLSRLIHPYSGRRRAPIELAALLDLRDGRDRTRGDRLRRRLLQQKKFFFTGGYLTDIDAAGVAGALGFLAVSLLSDAVVAGVESRRWRCSSSPGSASRPRRDFRRSSSPQLGRSSSPGLPPLQAPQQYVGDAFGSPLMFDLTGRKPGEIAAAAAQQLVVPLALVAAGAVAGLVGWAAQRFGPRDARRGSPSECRCASSRVSASRSSSLAWRSAPSRRVERGPRRRPAAEAEREAVRLGDRDRDRRRFRQLRRRGNPRRIRTRSTPRSTRMPPTRRATASIRTASAGTSLPARSLHGAHGGAALGLAHERRS